MLGLVKRIQNVILFDQDIWSPLYSTPLRGSYNWTFVGGIFSTPPLCDNLGLVRIIMYWIFATDFRFNSSISGVSVMCPVLKLWKFLRCLDKLFWNFSSFLDNIGYYRYGRWRSGWAKLYFINLFYLTNNYHFN